jgi:streptogramin lyase
MTMNRLTRSGLVLALALIGVGASAQTASAAYSTGDVFAAVGGNFSTLSGQAQIKRFAPSGTLAQTLTATSVSNENTGMCFDSAGNLYSTNFQANTITKFDVNGNVVLDPWADGADGLVNPESCVFDAAGNMYVGNAGLGRVVKFNPAGAVLNTYAVATEDRGADWIDLAADQCTLYYTSEGSLVKRFNVCTNTQLTDFASNLPAPCFALRIRPNGEVLVACFSAAQRLSAAGTVIQDYAPTGGGLLFALNLDPDGQTFWTGNIDQPGHVFRINIATEAVVNDFNTNANTDLAGLAVAGEITVARLRMVGKGSINGTTGGPSSYAYILNCNAAANTNAPFEVRFGTQRFRLTSASATSCTNDPAVTTPPAGFDTMTGTGTGTLTTGGPGTIQWKFVDGGLGGANDSAQITIKNSGGTTIFNGTAAPPGKFPGSDQPTGNNTAQSG